MMQPTICIAYYVLYLKRTPFGLKLATKVGKPEDAQRDLESQETSIHLLRKAGKVQLL